MQNIHKNIRVRSVFTNLALFIQGKIFNFICVIMSSEFDRVLCDELGEEDQESSSESEGFLRSKDITDIK